MHSTAVSSVWERGVHFLGTSGLPTASICPLDSAPPRRPRSVLLLVALGILGLLGTGFMHFWWTSIRMPGASFAGPFDGLTEEEEQVAQVLEQDVRHLAVEIGERNLDHHTSLEAAADWLDSALVSLGYQVRRQTYNVDAKPVHNIEVVLPGSSSDSEVVVVGAHYDSAQGTPGANDNGSGVAALLEIARRLAGQRFQREVRLVWFTNEEPPYFQTPYMGSLRYARSLKDSGRSIAAMLSLETMGYYSDDEHTQHYPGVLQGFYPNRGNFLAHVANPDSRPLLHDALTDFRTHVHFPSEGAALPESLPGIGWSDHWSFWRVDAQALMLTDTAPFRYPHYHQPTDTADKLDYKRLSRVTIGLVRVISSLANK